MVPGAGNILVFDALERAWRGDSLQDGQRSADIMPASQIVVPNETRSNRSNAYFPLDYLPQAIGMKIAMLVNLSPYAQWQAARISNSILYAIMGCFAIALLPRWKTLMALLLVIPPVAFVDIVYSSAVPCDKLLPLFLDRDPIHRGRNHRVSLLRCEEAVSRFQENLSC